MPIRTTTALALALCLQSLNATTPEEKNAYNAAIRAFEWSHFERAEKEFAQFIANFPDSDLASKAAAFRLRSRAHYLTDQSDHRLAADAFRQLRSKFPNSPNYLEFIVLEAWNEYHLGNRETVVNLLGDAKGPFQSASFIRSLDPAALKFQASGRLLLAQTYLEQKNYPAARQALDKATDWDINTEFQWRRQFILTRLHFAANEFEKALDKATSLLELAEATEKKEWIAESAAALGEVRIATNQKEAAILAYKKNLAEGIPQNRRREAWSKIIQLRREQSPGPLPFLKSLEQFIAESANDNALDVPLLALAKLKLQLYYQENKDSETTLEKSPTQPAELLDDALTKLEQLLREFPESPLRGQALYHIGWCYWEQRETEKSFSSFHKALNILPEGFEKDIAQFKLADGHYALKRYETALFHYQQIAARTEPTHPYKETFLAQVLYQTVRAAIKDGNPNAAASAVSDLITIFPDNLLANKGTFLFGQHMLQIPQSSEARKIFRQVIERFPDFPLKAEVELAIAYSHELDGNWKSAADAYQNWTTTHPNHKKQARAAYAKAWCLSQQGREEEAATLFQTFLEKHGKDKSPNNRKLANQARLWLGNHHFNLRNFNTAKQLYAEIFNTQNQQTNLITLRAQLMAGRTSFRQNQFKQTISQLETLRNMIPKNNHTNNYFKTLQAEVLLNLGDAYFERAKQLPQPVQHIKQDQRDIEEALKLYSQIQTILPNSRLWAVAQGRYADAYRFLSDYEQAKEYYKKVINSPPQQADISLRSQAEVALGIILEQEAEQAKTKAEQTALQKEALLHYRNVLHGFNLKGVENFDDFWRLEALRQAGALTIQLKGIDDGIQLYQKAEEKFTQSMPSLQLDWNSLIQTLKTNHKQPAETLR